MPDVAWAVRWGIATASLCLYFIVFSLGLVLTYGYHRTINFAHGAIYTVAAYSGLVVYGLTVTMKVKQ